MKPPIRHLFGVPILPVSAFKCVEGRGTALRSIEHRFAWGLTWEFGYPCRERVPALPSWSWAGWSLPNWTKFRANQTGNWVEWGRFGYNLDISIELTCGEVVSLEEALALSAVTTEVNSISRFLIVNGWIVELELHYRPDVEPHFSSGTGGLWVKVRGIGGSLDIYKCLLTETAAVGSRWHQILQLESWYGLVVNYDDDQHAETWKTVLVLGKVGDHYERIGITHDIPCKGIFWIDGSNYHLYPVQRKRIRLG